MTALVTALGSLWGLFVEDASLTLGILVWFAIAAFALSEPDAGSDVQAMTTRARRQGDAWVLDGTKTWISNGGIADVYTLFARTGEAPGARGISALWCFRMILDSRLPIASM